LSEGSQYGWTTRAAESGTLRFVRTTDISKGALDWGKVPFCQDAPTDEARFLLHRGDILISRAGSVGLSALIEDAPPAVFASYLVRFRLLPHVDRRFVRYFLQSADYWSQINERAVGIALQNVNAKKLSSITIPIAPLAEQARIVAAIETQFSRLDAATAALERARANLKRYRAAVLNAACSGRLVPTEAELARREGRQYEDAAGRLKHSHFSKSTAPPAVAPDSLPEGWLWATPEMLASKHRNALSIGPFGSNLKVSDYTDSGVPLVFVRNIRASSFGGPETRFVTAEKAVQLQAHSVEPGDILITKMGDPPGDACIYPLGRPSAIITADCIRFQLNEVMGPTRFFVDAINSEIGRRQFKQITKGVAQQKVSLGRFKEIYLPVPPRAEQERIVAEVERRLSVVERMEAEIAAGLARAERLRQAILQRAFTGRLVPQDPVDEPASTLLARIRTAKANLVIRPAKAASRMRKKPASQRKALFEVLSEATGAMESLELFKAAGFDTSSVEAFYAELKREVNDGRIVEHRDKSGTIRLDIHR
jgi:type I restriction enzyme S subunit